MGVGCTEQRANKSASIVYNVNIVNTDQHQVIYNYMFNVHNVRINFNVHINMLKL